MGRQKRDRKLGKGDLSQAAHAKFPSVASGAVKNHAVNGSERRWWQNPLLQGFAIMLMLMVLLWSMFVPRWETNDDCFMSMIAHGYGIAAEASPKLVFSNVLWGYLVQQIPWVSGIPGYSIAAAASLLLAGTAAGFALRRMGVQWYVVALVIILCFVRPLLLCQFTINAGLLAASGILCVLSFFRTGGLATLLLGCGLLVLGTLVRFEQAALVAAVGAPLVPWSRAIRNVPCLTAGIVTAASIAAAVAIDRWELSGSDWQPFWEFRSVQAPITDYRAGVRLQQSPELMGQAGLTTEEVVMLQRWGFVGKDLTSPERLQPAIDALGPSLHPSGLGAGAWAGVSKIFDPALLWMTVASAALLVLARNVPLIVAWAVFILAISTLGAMGRPGVERVYVPIYVALIGAGLVTIGRPSGRSLAVVLASLGIGVLAHVPRVMSGAEGNRELFARNATAMRSLDGMTVVAWGWWIFYERSYPAWGALPRTSVRIIGLNPYTYAPYSVAESEERTGRGVLRRIDSPEGALFVATDANYPLLAAYLRSKYGWTMVTEEVAVYPNFKLTRVRRSTG